MAAYKHTASGVLRAADGASIPATTDNSDWSDYLAWCAAGNTADPADALPTRPVYLDPFVLLGRLTLSEYTLIRQAAGAQLAAGNGQLEQWLDMARIAPSGINLLDPVTIAAKAAVVAGGLLTQARADAVFAAG